MRQFGDWHLPGQAVGYSGHAVTPWAEQEQQHEAEGIAVAGAAGFMVFLAHGYTSSWVRRGRLYFE